MATRISSRNFDTEVKKIINNIIPGCKNIYIRVGYFYFSGFSLIAKSLKDKNIKILVGIESDQKTTNIVKSEKEISEEYLKKFSETVDKDEILDKPEERDSYFIFKKKLKDGTLEVRQNKRIDHSKEFIFEYSDKNAKMFNSPGQTMVGSSNLTHSGFISNQETNVLIPDPENFKNTKLDFMDDWENSIPLLNKEKAKIFEKYSSKFPFEQTPSPYLMYVRVLNEYFKDRSDEEIKLPKDITEDYFENYKYQRDAIAKGLDILKDHNGVLIADVVGLGKSIIASAIANNIGLRTVVICPPHLKEQWKDYLYKFKVRGARIYTSGKILDALTEDTPGQKLIIIDEVHKFRNDETKDYLNLYQLCHDSNGKEPNKVVLLSATPFNNKPSDTFSLIKLFQIPTRSTLQTITNLSVYFERISKTYNSLKREQIINKRSTKEINDDFKKLGEEIRNIISPLIIRRSRIDLENIKAYDNDLKKQKIFFPKVEDPILLTYDLDNIEDIYKKTLKIIAPGNEDSNYKCARYKPLAYVKPECLNEVLDAGGYNDDEKKNKLPQQQQNIHDFIKRMMVRRFESSTHSFSITLDRVIRSNERMIEYYETKGVVPVYPRNQLPDLEELYGSEDDTQVDDFDIEKESKLEKFKNKGLWFIQKDQLKKSYIEDIKNDFEILKSIQKDWEILKSKNFKDPKTDAFREIIGKQLKKEPKRKIIIFTEFSDTANYLYKKIKKDFKAYIYTSKDSSKKRNKIEIKENFDASSKVQKNDYDIMIATDAISEGFNLHRAGTIFNYDIPYNPTRVVQRFGRINRINKKMFEKLYIYNFFPTDIGETEVNLKRITGLKKMMFNAIFGEDTKVLTTNETLGSYFQKQFDDIYKETESAETYFENIIYDLRDFNPEVIIEANNISKRVKAKRKIKSDNGLLIFSKKGDVPKFVFADKKKEIRNLLSIEALKIFEAKPNEKHINFDRKYDSLYEEIKEQIFAEQKILPPNKKKRDLINKLQLLSRESRYSDYYSKLHTVVKELDALTPLQLRTIRKITSKTSDKNIKKIMEEIPERLLVNLLKTYNEVELKKDALIITEQIND
ncbi:helicase-related protein [Candidatus Pelagibacter communis]|uniref:helicase-related protein n=1 Tax=Pelagibacter ubique TaxID=198252 RepID=UPI00094C861A|nr:helicase-related protein [Candidatus Pelagibacter ubique]